MAIKRHKKKCKDCGQDRYIYGRGLCKYCYSIDYKKRQQEKQRNNPKKNKKRIPHKSKDSRKSLVHDLDSIFSKVQRLQEANIHDTVECITCGATAKWDEIGLGHFIPRRYMTLRWYPNNGHPQCTTCNVQLDGNVDEYEKAIIERYGEEELDRILQMKRNTKTFAEHELESLIKKYTKEFEMLNQKLWNN